MPSSASSRCVVNHHHYPRMKPTLTSFQTLPLKKHITARQFLNTRAATQSIPLQHHRTTGKVRFHRCKIFSRPRTRRREEGGRRAVKAQAFQGQYGFICNFLDFSSSYRLYEHTQVLRHVSYQWAIYYERHPQSLFFIGSDCPLSLRTQSQSVKVQSCMSRIKTLLLFVAHISKNWITLCSQICINHMITHHARAKGQKDKSAKVQKCKRRIYRHYPGGSLT
jgi:hypothetical protein